AAGWTTWITSAPRSPRIMVANGPGACWERSRIFRPCSGGRVMRISPGTVRRRSQGPEARRVSGGKHVLRIAALVRRAAAEALRYGDEAGKGVADRKLVHGADRAVKLDRLL